ncbi:MAG TPA: DUF1800 domain-containing protein [Candidatus Tectomicrobia bacterium]
MTFDEARHLLARSSFGGTPDDIEALTRLSYAEAVDRLLNGSRQQPCTAPPAWVDGPPPDFRARRNADASMRQVLRAQRREQGLELKGWWYGELLSTDSPVTERLTLFWHNHFTSSLEKVRWPALLYRQNLLLRQHALGNFRTLLHAIAKDPAMILYLDGQTNRTGNPNENFARELLELFTLGEGYYSEQDVKESARAFTGWMVERRSDRFRFNARQHDHGVKTFLGRSGTFDGEAILDILLQQPRLAVHITEKLWRAFVSETPDKSEVQRLAALFRERDYAIRPLLYGLLTCRHFREARGRGTLVKSPVELIVGTVRLFHILLRDTQWLARVGRRLGQDLFDPPNVKGWPGGNAWITASTLLARQQFLQRLLRGQDMAAEVSKERPMEPMPGAKWPAWLHGPASAAGWEKIIRTLLPLEPVYSPPETTEVHHRVQRLVLDPVYQLQ